MMLNIAVLAPIPTARMTIAPSDSAGFFQKRRIANRKSQIRASNVKPLNFQLQDTQVPSHDVCTMGAIHIISYCYTRYILKGNI